MNRHLRVPSYWTQLAIFIMLFGGAFLLFGFLQFAVYNAMGINPFKPDLNDPKVLGIMKVAQGASSLIVFLLPAFTTMVMTYKGRYGYFLGFKKPERMNMYVLAVLVVILALPFVFWLGELNQRISLPDWMKQLEQDASKQMTAFLKVRSSWDVLINLFVIALLPAIGEEVCFRGVLQRIIIGITKNPWTGIIVTGFLFSALHLQFEGFLPRFLLGIILGILYWHSGSIWPSILGHFIFNATQVLWVSYAPEYTNKTPELPLMLPIVCGIAVFAILYFYTRQSTITYSKVYRNDDFNEHNEFLA